MVKSIVPLLEKKTKRQRIVEAIHDALKAAEHNPDVTTGDEAARPLFEFTGYGDVNELFGETQTPCCAVDQGTEEKSDLLYPKIEKVLRLYIGFMLHVPKGVDSYEFFNYYLGRVIEVCVKDHTLGGLTIDVQDAGNSPEISGPTDPTPRGELFLDVRYRHINGNPFSD